MSDKEIRIRLTEFQAGEVDHGLTVDSETDEREVWGEIEWSGDRWGEGTPYLRIWDADSAVWRITSSRDILEDNSMMTGGRERLRCMARARSLNGLVDKVVEAAGGPDALESETRRYVR